MQENKDKRLTDFGDDTVVFTRQPSASKPSAADMQNTAKLQGGAVIRPLKSQTPQRPAQTVQKQQPGQKLTPMQEAQRRQQQLREQQAAQKPSVSNTQRAQKQNIQTPAFAQASATSPAKTFVQPQMAQTKPQARTEQKPPVSPTTIRPIQPARPNTAAQNNIGPRAAMPSAPQNASIQRSMSPIAPKGQTIQRPVNGITAPNPTQTSGVNFKNSSSPIRGRNTPAQNNLPAVPQTKKRTEEDDFEIDEVTWSRKSKWFSRDNGASDSATSAVMSIVKAMVYIVAVIAVAVGLSVFIINTGNDVFKFVVEEKMVTVNIPEYATIEDVSDALYDAGAIKYKWAFNFWSKLKDSGAEFIPGTYEISTSLNYDYLRASFKESTAKVEVRITIPEGFTVDEIINRFVENGIGTREGFVDAIQNYDFDYRFLEGLEVSPDRIYRLEGYLFPDTYDFYQDSTEVAVLKKLLDNFDRKFVDEYYNRCVDLGMTVDEAITLASMVEKETRYADELGYVSSVFHNRLKYSGSFPFLNSDATIMYAMQHDLGGRPDNMSGDDTGYETPYNTYTNKGLPPGPIANPGLNSIKYALYPNDSNYFYFVSDSAGRMLFATTESEHIKNINTARGN